MNKINDKHNNSLIMLHAKKVGKVPYNVYASQLRRYLRSLQRDEQKNEAKAMDETAKQTDVYEGKNS